MSRITSAAGAWWSGRTKREQQLLMVMAGLFVATVVWLGVVRPVLAWRVAAATRAEAAAVTLLEVEASIGALQPARPAAVAPSAGGLEPLIRRTATAAALDVVTAMSPSGQLGFQLSSVGSAPLFTWLAVLEADHGVSICSLGITENADATLNVEGAVADGSCTT